MRFATCPSISRKMRRYKPHTKPIPKISAPIEPKASIPSGPSSGKPGIEYTFSAHETCDPSWDQICYSFDWGDEADNDIFGPYGLDKTVETKHSWISNGQYDVRVKVWLENSKEDSFMESSWSDPLTVNIQKNKQMLDTSSFRLLKDLLNRFQNAFPILRHLLKSFNSC